MPTDYIKMYNIEQTDDGQKYAAIYNNDGLFFCRTFGKESRSDDEIESNELNINRLLGI